MSAVYQILCVGLTEAELGLGDGPVMGDAELDVVVASDALSVKGLFAHPERWDLVFCDGSRFYDLGLDRCLADAAGRLGASVVLLRQPGNQLSPAEAAARGCADVVGRGDREHLRAVTTRELSAAAARKQLAALLSAGASASAGVAIARLRDFSAGADGSQQAGAAPGGEGDLPTPPIGDEAVKRRIEAGGLTLEYQPIVSLRGQREQRAMFEVLLRLKDASGQAMPPRRFFPAATRNHWLAPLDVWVFKRALPVLAHMQATKPIPASLYVNLSPETLSVPTMLDTILDDIDKAEIRPGSLVVEVRKESFNEPASMRLLAERLAENGHRLLLESFSPELCKPLGQRAGWFRSVKLDATLISKVEAGEIEGQVLRRCVLCAHNNGVTVIGMAVDSEPALARLYDLGVDYIQGHFVSLPYAQLVYPDLHTIQVDYRPTL
jgi:EAL domain-containing protein (putative c-di-GMP-specific phosphodiesterase class I)